MVMDRLGAEFLYNGTTYVIGAPIIATEQSEYAGQYGRILEIRDGKGLAADNEVPELYCAFDPPVRFEDTAALGKTCFAHIVSSLVCMTPEMVQPLPRESEICTQTAYKVAEEWAIDGQEGQSEAIFTNPDIAGYTFRNLLSTADASEWMTQWRGNAAFAAEARGRVYRCFLDGDYCANHYSIHLVETKLTLGPAQFQQFGTEYTDSIKCEDFEGEAEQIAEAEQLTDQQYALMLKDPDIPKLITAELQKNSRYWEEYWQSVDNVVCALIQKYRDMELPGDNMGGVC